MEVIGRLLGLGVGKDTLAENLRFSAAQRLIQKLCAECSIFASPDILSGNHLELLMLANISTANLRTKSEAGCSECLNGITGRVPALAYLTKCEITSYLSGNEHGQKENQSLQKAVIDLVEHGIVDVREVAAIG